MRITPLKALLLVSFLLVFAACNKDNNPAESSQSPLDTSLTFQKSFDFGSHESGQDILELNNGDYILAANSTRESDEVRFVTVIKTDTYGNKIWSESYGEDLRLACSNIVKADDGYIFGGNIGGNIHDRSSLFLTKIDLEGNEVWHYTYCEDIAIKSKTVLLELSNGNFLISGGGFSLSSSYTWMAKLVEVDTNGNIVNEITVDIFDMYYFSVCESVDSGYILGYNVVGSMTYIHKIDSQGNTVWQNDYTFNVGDISHTYGNCYVITGSSINSDLYLQKFDDSGTTVWEHSYAFNTMGNDVKETSGFDIIITGKDIHSNTCLIKVNRFGELLWRTQYNHEENAAGKCIIENNRGGFAVLGHVFSGTNGNLDKDILFTKTDLNGIVY